MNVRRRIFIVTMAALAAVGALICAALVLWDLLLPLRPRTIGEAISRGDVASLRRLLEEGANPHGTAADGNPLSSVFFWKWYGPRGSTASQEQKERWRQRTYEMTKVLLEYGANPNQRDVRGDFPVHQAVHWGMTDVLELLLQNGASPNVQDVDGRTPLMDAVGAGRMDMVKLILTHGGQDSVNWQDARGDTALHWANRYGDSDVVELLLQAGADPSLTNAKGRRPPEVPRR